MKRNHYSRSQN